MGDMLLEVGCNINVICNNELMSMLIIGKLVKDNDNIVNDYACVPCDEGYKGRIYFVNHRDVITL